MRRHIHEYMRTQFLLNSTLSDTDAFQICFKMTERHPLFKLQVTRATLGPDGKPIEESLEDPHSETFINVSDVKSLKCIFSGQANSDALKPVYKDYIHALHQM